MTVPAPDGSQQAFAELPLVNVLLIAPAGCGKTEALAHRARSLLDRRFVETPRKLLALTYSNKAKENLSRRMRVHLGPRWRDRVTVTNFHGLATRVIQNHGVTVGIPRDVVLPNRAWRARRLRELGIGYREAPLFESILRVAKADDADDEEVLSRIYDSGLETAIEYEEGLRSENRIDYDDQIRHAQRVLANKDVARLYIAHFAAVMVDEVQDLSLQQLSLVHAVGNDCVTYAGDPAQGIYSFAGAAPVEVFERIRARSPIGIGLEYSYRSTPAVLGAVNGLARQMGTQEIQCGQPDRWSDSGHVILLRSSDSAQEASKLLAFIDRTEANRTISFGLVTRRSTRLNDFRAIAEEQGREFTDWGVPTHIPRVVDLLYHHLRGAEAMEGNTLRSLEGLCHSAIDPADAETHDEIASACAALQDFVDAGASVAEAVAKCRAAPTRPDRAVPPGVHVLTGHLGKGQEFDWVVVVGLEKGHVPDFRNTSGPELEEELRVLHVMVSRARYGVVLTSAGRTRTRFGWRNAIESEWLGLLAPAITEEL